MRALLICGAICCFGISTVSAQVLNYTGYGANGIVIANSYGDTASVDVTHDIRVGLGNTASSNSPLFWQSGYGDLTDVFWGGNSDFSGEFGEIRFDSLTANPVTLNSLDLAGWVGDRTPIDIAVFDGSYNLLWSADNQFIPGDALPGEFASYSPNVSANSIILQWENPWGVAIDNISFTPTAIPEPTALGILGLAATLLVGLRNRRRRNLP